MEVCTCDELTGSDEISDFKCIVGMLKRKYYTDE